MIVVVDILRNDNCFVILHNDSKRINYDAKFINKAKATLVKTSTKQRLIIDCSHRNSPKNHKN